MVGIIYKYTNKLNGKVYIGQTIHENARKNEHKCHAKSRPHTQSAFYNAIDKYGWDNFEYTVLKTVSADTMKELKSKLNPLEIEYIQKYNSYNNGYNNTLGGDHVGHKPRAILEYDIHGNFLNRYSSYNDIPIENCRKTRVYWVCNHNNATFRGHIWRWEDNDLSKMPFDYGSKSKYIYYQWSPNMELIKEWPSVVLAQKERKFDTSAIIKCCKGKWKNHKGFIWTRKLKK